MVIYKIENKLNGKCYIGQTTQSLKTRIQGHLRSDSYISKALNRYGIESFEISIIDTSKTIDDLNEKEIFWIKEYNSLKPNGYNLCEGGGVTLGFKHRDYSKRAMSRNKKGKYTGEDNHFYGKKHSKETRDKMKHTWATRREMTPEMKDKLRKAHVTISVVNVDTGQVFDSCKAAAQSIGVNSTQITRVCKGRNKTSGGFKWMYYDEYMKISCQDSKG